MGRNVEWDLELALSLLRQGKNYREIAEIMGLKRSQVYGTLRYRGLNAKRGPGGRKLSWNFTRARELLQEGKTCGEIARALGLTYGQVYSALNCRGLPAGSGRGGRKLDWDLDRAVRLLNNGKNCVEIANVMGLRPTQVRSAFRRRGIAVEPKTRCRQVAWDLDKAKKLAEQGKALCEIAQILGVRPENIRNVFKRRGLEIGQKKRGRHVNWDVEKAIELRQVGWPWGRIEQELGLPGGTVREYFVRHGLHVPRPQPNMKWDIAEAKRLREQGWGWKEIGEKVGTHGNNIRRALARQGLHVTRKKVGR